MNVTADLAIISVTVLGLAMIASNHRVAMRVADRVRVVNPPKQETPKETVTGEKQ